MLGRLDPECKQVTVVGAGVAGLLAAYELDKRGYEVTLIEAAKRAGGLISTERTEHGIAEAAAHSILMNRAVEALFDELGLELLPVRKESKARYIMRGGRIRKFPLSVREAVGAFLRAYFVLAPRKLAPESMTFEQWADRFLGEKVRRYLLTPFLRGIYGADPKDLLVSAVYPKLAVPAGHSLLSYQVSRALRGPKKDSTEVAKAKPRLRGMVAPKGGMQSLIDALEARVRARLGDRFRLGQEITELPKVRNLVLTVPAPAAARLLAPVSPELSQALSEVRYTPLVTVTAFVAQQQNPALPRGVGVLFPDGEGREALGILFNSSSFEGRVPDEAQIASYTVILGGTSRPELVNLSEAEIEQKVAQELRLVLGAKEVRAQVVRKWERAVPRYDAQLQGAWSVARRTWCAEPGHVLFGNYTGQVSLRGMIEFAAQLGAN